MGVPVNVIIKNPRVLEIIAEQRLSGAGRNYTETAENLILDGADARRLKRSQQVGPPADLPSDSHPATRVA